jgi:putative CocE/NonD family hydrolase
MALLYRLLLKRFGVAQTHPVSIRRNVKVRMPDGAELVTDLYLSSATAGRPVVLIRSPYGRSLFLAAATAYPFAAQGFNAVLQSCRGTFGSSGRFDPHHDEQRDGLATIEWIKQQAWYGGSIATFGPSYLGYTQWAMAASAGPELRAMALQVTLSDFSRMTYSGNSFALENAFTWTRIVSMSSKQRLLALRFLIPGLRRRLAIREEQWMNLPLASMDQQVIGERVAFWQDWMEHSSADDPWWAPMNFHGSISEVKRPISMVAGWFDIFVPWQMRDFIALRRAGCEARITIGPWGHTNPELGRAGIHDAIDWFNRHLLNKNAAARPKPVKLYVIGADAWRYFDEWPPNESIAERWYLQPRRGLGNRMALDSGADQYHYDPAAPTPSVGGPALMNAPFSVDNTELEARHDVLTYTSEPLQRDRDIIGTVTAELYVSSTAASADFFVRLCDVDTEDASRNICDGLQRVQIVSNAPQCVRVELWPTAYRVLKGHRLRVQVSSGAFPRWARNLGGDEPLAHAAEAHAATQSVYYSQTCPSAVIVPFCGESFAQTPTGPN